MLTQEIQTRNSRVIRSFSMVIIFIIIALASSVSYAQSCQSHGTNSFTFKPKFLGDSMTVSVGLSACETVALTETHDMQGDGNRGTNVKMTYLNSSGQALHAETLWGFYTGGNSFPASTPWPYPWRGTVSANWTVASLKLESTGVYGKGSSNQEPEYNFTLTYATRSGYNTSGDSFGTAANAALPSTYRGSFYDSTDTPPDAGQYFKVHLKCRQAMYIYGSATGSSNYGAVFRADIYDSSQSLVTSNWVILAAYGTATFTSNAFTNPNNSDADSTFTLRARSGPFTISPSTSMSTLVRIA